MHSTMFRPSPQPSPPRRRESKDYVLPPQANRQIDTPTGYPHATPRQQCGDDGSGQAQGAGSSGDAEALEAIPEMQRPAIICL